MSSNQGVYLSQSQAAKLDQELMSDKYGFSIDQLMELAGLSCACALHACYPPATHSKILVFAGPGNNGGDGLVAARHLHHFGYPTIHLCYPKPTDKPLYIGLRKQCETLGIQSIPVDEALANLDKYHVVMDALFGFSFHGAPRPPFDAILSALSSTSLSPRLVSIDIPSGWDVDQGDVSGTGLRPHLLISLTAPKQGVRHFRGEHHYLGGRFVPPGIVKDYQLEHLPHYPGTDCCVKLSK